MPNRDVLVADLIVSDDRYRQLHDEHQELERRLEALYHKSLPSEQDELEMKRIKHEKLRLKDEMAELLRAREGAEVSA